MRKRFRAKVIVYNSDTLYFETGISTEFGNPRVRLIKSFVL